MESGISDRAKENNLRNSDASEKYENSPCDEILAREASPWHRRVKDPYESRLNAGQRVGGFNRLTCLSKPYPRYLTGQEGRREALRSQIGFTEKGEGGGRGELGSSS